MALLFFGGIMNVLWISGLAIYGLFEKTVGHWHARAVGVLVVVARSLMLVAV